MVGNKFAPGGVKGFLAFHVEKVVLGVCVALVGLFFCLGWGVDVLPSSETPGKLYQLVMNAENHIKVDSWNDIKQAREISPNHLERAVQSRKRIVEGLYAITALKRPLLPLNEKRSDPELYKPEHARAAVFVAAVQRPAAPGLVDKLMAYPDAVAKIEEPKPKPKPKRERRRRRSMEDDGSGFESYPEGTFDDDSGADDADLGGSGIDDADLGGGSSDPLGMGYGGLGGVVRTLSELQLEEIKAGTLPFEASGQNSVARGMTVVAVTAVVPYARQREEYDRCLSESMGYDEKRDQPEYFYMIAQRAEVRPGDGPVDPASLKWQLVTDTQYEQRWNQYWAQAATAEELVDRSYIHPALASRVPPVMGVSAVKLATHPDVEFKTPKELAEAKMGGATSTETTTGLPPDSLEGLSERPPGLGGVPPAAGSSFDDATGFGPEGGEPGMNEESGFGFGEGEDSGMGLVGGTQQYADKLLVRFYDYRAERGKSYVYRVKVLLRDPNDPIPSASSNDGGFGATGGTGTASTGAAGGTGGTGSVGSGVDSGLGGSLTSFDPSSVGVGHPPVPDRELTPEVIARKAQARAAAEAAVAAAKAKGRRADPSQYLYYRATEYSDPTPVVRVPQRPQSMLAGHVDPPRIATLDPMEKDPSLPQQKIVTKEGKATILSVVWDDELGVNVPGESEAFRGSVLNFTTSADVLHPIMYSLKTIKDYVFKTDTVVLDIRGGENLGTSKNPLNAPGEILLMDKEGNLIVRNDLDPGNAEQYRRQLFIEDRPAPPEPTTPLDGGPDGGMFDDASSPSYGSGIPE